MQVFSNNALTTLAAELAIDGTSMTVTSSTAFATITSPEFELVTLEVAPDTREIVKVTARSGDTWTITRAQESTSAAVWPIGSKVEARATAGTMAGMQQKAVGSIALGSSASANATDGTAVGISASAGGAYSTALGSNASSSGQGSFAVGYAALSAGADSVSIGANSDATTAHALALGSLAQAAASKTVAAGYAANAAGDESVAVGVDSSAPDNYAVAIGRQASAGVSSTSLGNQALAPGANSVALGASSVAHGEKSCCLNGLTAFAKLSIVAKGYYAIPEDDWNDQFENWSAGTQSVFATPYVDLAVPSAWQASTQYAHGKVVAPTAGGTVQYRAWCSYADETLLHLTPTSGTTEPTWPGAGGSIAINETDNAEWIGIDLDAGYETETFPDWLEFWPSSIAFICHEFAATTGTPTVSVGTVSAPTLILNAASVGITGAGQVFQFTMPNPCPRIPEGESILVTLDGAASAGQMVGRFLFTGAFVATRGRV